MKLGIAFDSSAGFTLPNGANRSPSDSLTKLQDKMQEYIANGIRLGWLIDPRQGCVEIYRPNQDTESIHNPASLMGDPELPEFYLYLDDIM